MIKEKSSAVSLIQELLSAKKELISAKKIMDKKDKHVYPISNVPFKIPNTWQWVFLSDISILQEGPGIRKHQYQDNGIQFLTVTNILEGSVDLFKSQKYISIDEYNERYKHYTINKGDIVIACSGATWGKSAIYENEDVLMLNTSTLRLRFFNDLGDNKFLYFLTKSNYFKSNLASHSTGQQPNYGYSHYSKIPIPIPPIEEQKRIVDLLNEVLYKIDQAKANIEKNIENAKDLFQSKLNDIFSQKGDGWKEKTLKEISTDFGRGKSKNRPRNDKKLFGGKYPFVQTGDIRNTGKILKIFSQTYNEIGLAQSKLWPKGTICITIAANIAETAILNFDSCFPDSMIGLVVDTQKADSNYTYYALQFLKSRLQELGKGSAQDNINLGTFQKQYFPSQV